MDGTAGLSFYFAKMETDGKEQAMELTNNQANVKKDDFDAIVRVNPERR